LPLSEANQKKLEKVLALHVSATTDGEVAAALQAAVRLVKEHANGSTLLEVLRGTATTGLDQQRLAQVEAEALARGIAIGREQAGAINGSQSPPARTWQDVAQELLAGHRYALTAKAIEFLEGILARGRPTLTQKQQTWLLDIADKRRVAAW
jgi:hypothetical protein